MYAYIINSWKPLEILKIPVMDWIRSCLQIGSLLSCFEKPNFSNLHSTVWYAFQDYNKYRYIPELVMWIEYLLISQLCSVH